MKLTSSSVSSGESVRFPPWLLITEGGLSGQSLSAPFSQMFLFAALGNMYVLGRSRLAELITELRDINDSMVFSRRSKWGVEKEELEPSTVRRKSLKNFILALPSFMTSWPMSLKPRLACFPKLTVLENAPTSSRIHKSTTSRSSPISIAIAARFSWITGISPDRMEITNSKSNWSFNRAGGSEVDFHFFVVSRGEWQLPETFFGMKKYCS